MFKIVSLNYTIGAKVTWV